MKQLSKFSIILFSLVFWGSCAEEAIEINNAGNNISFSKLKVGQQSKYAFYTSRIPWSDSDTAYKFGNDTIILTVIAQNDTGFKISEEHTSQKIAPFFYYFKVEGDSLKVQSTSGNNIESVVLAGAPRSFPLKNNDSKQWTANQWAVLKNPENSKGFGSLSDVTISKFKYLTPLVAYDPNAMIYDGPAFTQIYTPKDGFLCFQALGGFAPFGNIYYFVP